MLLGLVSLLMDVASRLGSDVIQLSSVVRQIAIKSCVVFSAGLFTSIVAFILLRRLEPANVPVTFSSEPIGPIQRPLTSTITLGRSDDGRMGTGSVVADRTNRTDIKIASNRLPFSETNV